ncbi:hypothetical protein ACHHYP_01405 [Achlya hypogyna]|uniref:tRNA-binding domain-containing protein n=1 Tax=Achlya hypogyna TaxID=1202772 RepID=A0A1V9Z932_ACHHY|nr:hypothetical protein ACHHYP_01405 [Achlya hypogyna]
MSLSLDKSEESAFLRFAARFCGVKTSSAAHGDIRLKLGNVVLNESNTIVRYFARAADRELELLGATPLEQAEIAEWMSVAANQRANESLNNKGQWDLLDAHLATRVYFVATRPTLADATLFWVVYKAFAKNATIVDKHANLRRWFNQLQHTVGIRGFESTPLLDLPVHQHLLMVHTTTTGAPAADKPAADKKSPATPASPRENQPAQDNKAEKKAKKDDKPKKEKKPAAAPVAEAQPDITKLDIRVGKITKVWKHETADKLYCEEIDVGEEAPRQIASGLVKHYSLEQMEGRMCLVMCNLKPRALVGFKSHGMVLCAVKTLEDGTERVAFVEPPAGAKPGERITYEGLTGEPLSPAQVEKQKVLVAAGEGLKSDAHGVAYWKDHKFVTSAGPCTSPTVTNGILR